MPPADHDALRDAVATVRRLAAAESNGELLGELRVSPTWQAATELIARQFLSLLDAGELVRKVSADDCVAAANELIERGYCSTNGLMSLDLLRYRVAVVIASHTRLAAALEPLLATEARP